MAIRRSRRGAKPKKRPGKPGPKKSLPNEPVSRENYVPSAGRSARGFGSARFGRVGIHRKFAARHPLVGDLLRVRVPYRRTHRVVLLRVLSYGGGRGGELLRVRAVRSFGIDFKMTRWIALAEVEFLLRVGLADVVLSLPCTSCGGTMYYQRDGLVDDRPQPFFACNRCETCVVV